MKLSKEQEAQYLLDHSKPVWRIVNSFRSGIKYTTSDEDLYQEAMLVLLSHLRNAKDEEELKIFPRLAIKNALCRYLIKQEVVSFPGTRTTDYSKVVKATRRVPIESATNLSYPELEENILCKIDMESYLKTIPEKARELFLARLSGEKPTEIAKRMNLTPGAITHSVQKTLKCFLQERNAA